MMCTREVPKVETDYDGSMLGYDGIEVRELSDEADSIIGAYEFVAYINALKHCNQEEVRQCILEACG